MFCIQCGANLPEVARFCPACGARQPEEADSRAFRAGVSAHGGPTEPEAEDLFRGPQASANATRPDSGESGTAATGPFARVTVPCKKCNASTPVLSEVCISCGALLDPNLRFGAMVKAGKAQHMSTPSLRKAIRDSGVAGKGKGCGCGALLLWVAFWWLMGATAFAAAVPGTLAWTAPVTCPTGYTDVVIPVSVSSFQGKTSMSASMYCIDAEGFAVEVSPWIAFPLLGAFFGAGAGLLVLLLPLWGWIRSRPPRARPNPRIGGNRPTLPGSSGRRLS